MKNNFGSAWKTAIILGAALSVALPSIAQNHKPIPLDAGGWFSGFAIHPQGRLYGYGDVFGAFRSDNAGATWTYLNRNMPARYYAPHDAVVNDNFVHGIAVDRGNADRVAFRTPSHLWLSTDGGTEWNATLTDLQDNNLTRGASPVMFHPGNGELWTAGKRSIGPSSLWRLQNGSWTKVGGTTFDSVHVRTIYVHPSPSFNNQIWVGADSGLYVSTDGGNNWTQVWSGGLVKAIVRNSKGIAYMAAFNGGYVITSTDPTWNNNALSAYTVTKTLSDSNINWGPENATVLANDSFVSGGAYANNPLNLLAVSNANGTGWTAVPGMNLSPSPRPIWSTPIPPGTKVDLGRDFVVQDPKVPSRWFMTGGFSPAVTQDSGQNWQFISNGIAAVVTTKVNFARNQPDFAMIPASDIGATIVNDGGASGRAAFNSRRQFGSLHNFHEVMSNDGQTLIAAGVEQNANRTVIIKSTNGGSSWTPLPLTNSRLPENHEGVTRSVMNPSNSNDFLVLLGYNEKYTPNNPGLWRTTDGGATFNQITNGLLPMGKDVNPGSRYHPYTSFLESDTGPRSQFRYLAMRSRLFRSSTDGDSWAQLTTHPFGGSWIHGFAVDRAKPGKLWAAGSTGGLKYSNNGGDSWNSVSGFMDARRVDAFNGRVAVWGRRTGDGGNFKIYYSSNDGDNWVEATGLNNRYPSTTDVAVDPFEAGKVWVSGISVNVITNIPSTGVDPNPGSGSGVGSGTGLTGRYFGTNTFSPLVNTQIDERVNFNWGNESPTYTNGLQMSSVGPDNFSVRWTGQIQAIEAGTYKIAVIADDTAKVWINDLDGNPIINQTAFNQGNPISVDFPMSASQKYNIKIEFTEIGGGARMQLIWTRPGSTVLVNVPKTQLYPTTVTATGMAYDFNETEGQFAAVDGDKNGINFGTSIWGAGNYFGFNSQSGWFWDDAQESRSFTLPTGRYLKSIKLSTGLKDSTWRISDGVNTPLSGEFDTAESPITIPTGWSSGGRTITITFSARWDSGIDDIVY